MDSMKGKVFVGGLKREATAESLRSYFREFGAVKEILIVVDKGTHNSKCFGFVTFEDPTVADHVLKQTHLILGRKVDVKPSKPKKQSQPNQEHVEEEEIDSNDRNKFRKRKIFVGGLPGNTTAEEMKNFFENFGKTEDVVVMHDKVTGKPRGFGFVTFDSEESMQKALQNRFYKLNGRQVEVKKAEPRERLQGTTSMKDGNFNTLKNNIYGENQTIPYEYYNYVHGYMIPTLYYYNFMLRNDCYWSYSGTLHPNAYLPSMYGSNPNDSSNRSRSSASIKKVKKNSLVREMGSEENETEKEKEETPKDDSY